MKPEAQRIAIAEACGWTCDDMGWWYSNSDDGTPCRVPPDYLNDLNAMHEAEKVLFASKPGYYQRSWYGYLVFVTIGIDATKRGWSDVDTRHHAATAHATAVQRAEAFLRTIGKWTET